MAVDWLPVVAGPFIGSFLLVVVLRYPDLDGVVGGRSRCPHCGARIAARDLVPIASWVRLGGRCRCCGGAIGWQYPAVEVAAAGVALWAATVDSGWLLWASCGLGWVLLAMALIDIRCWRLPDFLTLPTLLAGLGVTALAWPEALLDHAIGAAVGYGLFGGVSFLYRVLRGREGLGLGDAKLLAAGGAWVSWQALPWVVLVAALLGLAVAVGRALLRRAVLSARTPVPFGPCLAAAIWVVWLYRVPGLAL
jgi:leader peptidase (prepilin peptidase)/N-methyltransferase